MDIPINQCSRGVVLNVCCSSLEGNCHKGEIERTVHPPPTNSKNRLKLFCEVVQATLTLGQMFLLLVREYQWRFW